MYKYNMGGSVPRETNIGGQRHSLAYINPFEEDLLNTQYRGGEGQPMPPVPGPGGVPSYYYGQGMQTTSKEFQEGKTGTGKSSTFASSKPQKQSFKDSKEDKAQARKNKEDKILSDAAAVAADKEIAKMLASGTYTKNIQGALVDSSDDSAGFDFPDVLSTPTPLVVTTYKGQQNVGPQGPLAPTTSVRPPVRPDDLKGERTGIMGIVDDIVRGGKTILSDIAMTYYAGTGTPEERKQKLFDAGYSPMDVDDFMASVVKPQERITNQPIFRDDDKDMTAAVIDDPCPEGYKLDPITNQCVMDDTIDVLNPGGQQVTDFVMPSVNPVIGQAANYTGAVAPMNAPMPLQPYAPGTSGNLLQSSAPGLARTRAGGIMGL